MGGSSPIGALIGAGLAVASGGTLTPLMGALGGAMVGSMKDQADAASQANDLQKQQMQQAQQQASKQADMQDQANNAANRKSPDLGAIVQANRDQGGAGANSTLLTGATGANQKDLTLGRQTLLGS